MSTGRDQCGMQVAGALLGEVRTQVGMLDRIGDSTTGANDMLKSSLAKFNKVRVTVDASISYLFLVSIWCVQLQRKGEPSSRSYRVVDCIQLHVLLWALVRRKCCGRLSLLHAHDVGPCAQPFRAHSPRAPPPTQPSVHAGIFKLGESCPCLGCWWMRSVVWCMLPPLQAVAPGYTSQRIGVSLKRSMYALHCVLTTKGCCELVARQRCLTASTCAKL